MQQNKFKSLVMIITAMLIWGSIGIFRRYIPWSSAALACYRGLVGALFLLVLVKLRGRELLHGTDTRTRGLLLLSGAFIGLNWILLFEAFNYTTIPTATLCYYMEPTFVVLLSPIFFKERLTPKKILCTLVALLGMACIAGVFEAGLPPLAELKGIIFGLAAGLVYAGVVILNKKLPGIDAYEKSFLQIGAAGLALVPYVLLTGQEFSWELSPLVISMLVIVGLVHTGVAYALYFGSMDGLKTQSIAIISYLDPISALVLSALILGETMTMYGIIGAVLILGAAFCLEQDV